MDEELKEIQEAKGTKRKFKVIIEEFEYEDGQYNSTTRNRREIYYQVLDSVNVKDIATLLNRGY
jgi:hypothetical protein